MYIVVPSARRNENNPFKVIPTLSVAHKKATEDGHLPHGDDCLEVERKGGVEDEEEAPNKDAR